MRSRYSAFALGLGQYIHDTLARDHDDRAVPPHVFSRAKERQRFLGLCILHAVGDEVLFYATVFEKGVDRSFAELSTFVHEEGRWRYASGVIVPGARLPTEPRALTREAFLELAASL
jgi:SEC-C motif-containing protein